MWAIKFSKRAFTVVELLVSIGIIAVLAAATISLIGPGPRRKSRDTRRQADLTQIAAALELYKADLGGYPSGGIGVLTSTPSTANPYLRSMPTDPSTGASYAPGYVPGGCIGAICASYTLCTNLETLTPGVTNCSDYSVTSQ